MERNWYVICTKQKKERKLVSALIKKGIENFCPFTIREIKNVSRSSRSFGPLFSSFVFVNVEPEQLTKISRMAYVINPLYWGHSPAIINADEINAIKMMAENYSAITLDKLAVDTAAKISVTEKSITAINNNTVSVMHQGISVKLPTLGYCITADRRKEMIPMHGVKKQTPLQAVAQRLNALFF
jgi:transcription antitermination factor NusG